ncbi:MAG: molybdate ABC transporter substrate-binding protein [Planctomycetaceae bacterium]
MNRTIAVLGSSLLLVVILLAVMVDRPDPDRTAAEARPPVLLFCAASNRAVMEAVRTDYEAETGRRVEIQYGASQTLLSSLEVSRTGDLYLPADDSYLALSAEKGLTEEVLPLATMRGVVVVPKGNPRNISAFSDLLKPDLKLVQANPDAAAIGKVTRATLQQQNLWDSLAEATTAYRGTVSEVANDVMVGAADAGIAYDAVLSTYPDLQAVELPELQDTASQISVAVVATSQQPTAALHFARYLAAEDRGLKRYAEFGFRPVQGDVWEDTPELTMFAGSMLRPAIENTIAAFEKREGVRVSRVYNGCGILVAQMKAGQHPDTYFACDTEFMKQVPDLFPESVSVSQNQLVILVAKGNPLDITSLKDLTKPGLKVGIGHEKQCAMGWLTQNTLKEGGLQQEVMENVTVQTPTGDMLVNQLRTGSLDAAVAYLSNAAGSGEFLDAVPIEGIACSIATQPFAIAEKSPHRHLAARLFQQLCSADSQQTFADEGFRFQWTDSSKPTNAAD